MFKKIREPLPVKSPEEMPNARVNIKYKDWIKNHNERHKWRNRRWAVLLFFNILFTLSFMFDLSVLEGSLSGSRLLGFYLVDPYMAFQLLAISVKTGYLPYLTMNFAIGIITVFLFYVLMGGRSFCSWICPYHFLAEWAEKLHDYLVKNKKIKEHTFQRGLRYVFWVGFLVVAFITERLVFESFNPVGMLSRILIYGPGLILIWIFVLILFEIVYSKRFWCRYVCPVGATWSMVGKISPMTIKLETDKCGHCRICQDVCLVPHELWFVVKGQATDKVHYAGSDCTRCGYCVDICPGDALNFTFRGLDKII